jgi:hypothetical protein
MRHALADGLFTQEEMEEQGLVGILTSSGLKSSLALSHRVPPPPQIEATEQALRALLM